MTKSRLTCLLPTALLFLSGCFLFREEETARVYPSALAWLHGEQGELLRFRNDTAGMQNLRVSRTEHVYTNATKSADNPYQRIDLVFRSEAAPEVGVGIQAAYEHVTFHRISGFEEHYVRAATYPARDSLLPSPVRTELLDSTTLHGRIYARVLHAWLGPTLSPTEWPVVEFYYSKADGLIGYRTNQRQVWWREF